MCIYIRMCTYVCTYIYICIYIHLNVFIHLCVCISVYTYTNMYTCIYVYSYIHIYIYVHILVLTNTHGSECGSEIWTYGHSNALKQLDFTLIGEALQKWILQSHLLTLVDIGSDLRLRRSLQSQHQNRHVNLGDDDGYAMGIARSRLKDDWDRFAQRR